jgi:hypothetical protein
MKSKSIELVKSLWLARKSEQKDLLECFDVLAEEVKAHNRENKRLNDILTMAETIEKIASKIEKPKLRRTDSDSYNELLNGPREKKPRVDDPAPGAGPPDGGAPDGGAPQAPAPQSQSPAPAPAPVTNTVLQSNANPLLNYTPDDSTGVTVGDSTGVSSGVSSGGGSITISNPLSTASGGGGSSSSSNRSWFG